MAINTKLSVGEMVRLMKGRSSLKIQEEFPQMDFQFIVVEFFSIIPHKIRKKTWSELRQCRQALPDPRFQLYDFVL